MFHVIAVGFALSCVAILIVHLPLVPAQWHSKQVRNLDLEQVARSIQQRSWQVFLMSLSCSCLSLSETLYAKNPSTGFVLNCDEEFIVIQSHM